VLLGFLPIIPGSSGDEIAGLLAKPARKDYPWHHLLPQREDLAEEFARLGIDIEEHLVSIPLEVHVKIHQGAPRGGLWNLAWENFFKENPGATKKDVFMYLGELIHVFKLDGDIQRVP
jgi:uncharacterized lipoprotein (TIGR02269 family)